jgi:hypothetical protein
MAHQRSLAAARWKLSKSKSLLERWSAKHGWVKRIAAWDAWNDRESRKELEQERRRARQAARNLPEPLLGVQRSAWDLELGPHVVQMPAQSLLILREGVDEIVAMIGEQPNIERSPVQVRAWDVLDPFLQRCSGDGERVDRVGLPALARGAASACHVFRSDPHDVFPARDEESLERTGHVPAVLDRPDPLGVELARPPRTLSRTAPDKCGRAPWLLVGATTDAAVSIAV